MTNPANLPSRASPPLGWDRDVPSSTANKNIAPTGSSALAVPGTSGVSVFSSSAGRGAVNRMVTPNTSNASELFALEELTALVQLMKNPDSPITYSFVEKELRRFLEEGLTRQERSASHLEELMKVAALLSD